MKIDLLCKSCTSNNLVKIGRSSSGQQRYKCKSCNKTMQLNYLKIANRPIKTANITMRGFSKLSF